MHRMVNRMRAAREASRGPSSCSPSCASCQNAVAVAVAVVVAVAVAAAALELTHYRLTTSLLLHLPPEPISAMPNTAASRPSALVTGASGGIGRDLAKLLAAGGHDL